LVAALPQQRGGSGSATIHPPAKVAERFGRECPKALCRPKRAVAQELVGRKRDRQIGSAAARNVPLINCSIRVESKFGDGGIFARPPQRFCRTLRPVLTELFRVVAFPNSKVKSESTANAGGRDSTRARIRQAQPRLLGPSLEATSEFAEATTCRRRVGRRDVEGRTRTRSRRSDIATTTERVRQGAPPANRLCGCRAGDRSRT
jgi:hypothetical protein